MGLSTSGTLAEKLIASGWAPFTPVIAVSRVSQPAERRITTTLTALTSGTLDLSGPTLLLIGEVASLDAAGVIERLDAIQPHLIASEPAYA